MTGKEQEGNKPTIETKPATVRISPYPESSALEPRKNWGEMADWMGAQIDHGADNLPAIIIRDRVEIHYPHFSRFSRGDVLFEAYYDSEGDLRDSEIELHDTARVFRPGENGGANSIDFVKPENSGRRPGYLWITVAAGAEPIGHLEQDKSKLPEGIKEAAELAKETKERRDGQNRRRYRALHTDLD